MKAITLSIYLLLGAVLCSQDKNYITGIIVDSEGIPVSNVEVCLEAKEICVYTDMDGEFKIEAEVGDRLHIYNLGGEDMYYDIDKNTLKIYLPAPSLDEIMVVGHSDKADKISAEVGRIEPGDYDTTLSGVEMGISAESSAMVSSDAPLMIRGTTSPSEMRIKSKESAKMLSYSDDGKEIGAKYSLFEEEKDIMAGQLTAGEVNDFGKWYYWSDMENEYLNQLKEEWKIYPNNRYCVILTQPNGNPVLGKAVQLSDSQGNIIWESITDNSGKAELWANPFLDQEDKKYFYSYQDETGNILKDKAVKIEDGVNFGTVDVCKKVEKIDIAFMMDATGSMGDEMRYLQSEIYDVMRSVKDTLPHVNLKLASVFYRDHGDEYVIKKQDFELSLVKTSQFLNEQRAGGGGDYPEAYVEALDESINNLNWRKDSNLKILFVILDAPPHHSEENIAKLHQLYYKASKLGIKIIPVSSSGVDKLTEYLMRTSALLTNGTYTFLTDDSGIGNPHIKPTIDTYEVEKLNALMKRLILQYAYSNDCEDETPASPTSSFYETQIVKETQNPDEKPLEYQVYPIPTHDYLNWKSDEKIDEVQLIDFMGKILWRTTDTKKFQLNIERFPKGVYYLRIFQNDKAYTKKVIFN